MIKDLEDHPLRDVDPVCGKDVSAEDAIVIFKMGGKHGKPRYRYFCSEKCARIFQKSHLGL